MKALIMAAGYGTRLEPLTKSVPKPMVLVVNKPILEYNIELLQKFGIKDICMNIHYHPEQIENYFQDGFRLGVALSYSYEERLLGTAGGVKRMAELMGVDDTFLVVSADNLTDINIAKMVAYHKSKRSLVTIALTETEDISSYGIVVTDKDGRVTAFQEKPSREEAQSKWANAGIYVCEREVLDLIPSGNPYDFGKELFPKLVEAQQAVYGYQMVEYWGDVGNIEAYLKTNADALQGLVCVKIGGRKTAPNLFVGKGTRVHRTAIFEGVTFIGDRTDIGKNTKIIGTSTIGDMCIIGSDVVVKNSIIWPGTYIGPGSFIEESIVGSWCHLGEHTHLGKLTVIGNRSNIKPNTELEPETKLLPKTDL